MVNCKKNGRMVLLPDSEKNFFKTSLLVSTDDTNLTDEETDADGQTNKGTDTARWRRPRYA